MRRTFFWHQKWPDETKVGLATTLKGICYGLKVLNLKHCVLYHALSCRPPITSRRSCVGLASAASKVRLAGLMEMTKTITQVQGTIHQRQQANMLLEKVSESCAFGTSRARDDWPVKRLSPGSFCEVIETVKNIKI